MILDELIVGTPQNGVVITKDAFFFVKDDKILLSITPASGEEGVTLMITPKGGDNLNNSSISIGPDSITFRNNGKVEIFIGMIDDESLISGESFRLIEDGSPGKFLD